MKEDAKSASISRQALVAAMLSAGLFITAATAGTAQDIYQYPGNVFYAPYMAINDHPKCAGPGKIAFKTRFMAKNLTAFIHAKSAQEDERFVVGGNLGVRNERSCYLKTRRGVESRQIAVRCPSEKTGTISAERLRAKLVPPILSGEITACLSVDGFSAIEAKWSLIFNDELKKWVKEGTASELWLWFSHPANTAERPDQRSRILSYPSRQSEYRLNPIVDLALHCLPLQTSDDAEFDLYISIDAKLALQQKNIEECESNAKSCYSRIGVDYLASPTRSPFDCAASKN